MSRRPFLLSFITAALIFSGASLSFAQSPQITSIERCINSNPDCNGAVNNPGEIAIRWRTDPSSGSSDPVTRVYLHGPFNTVEGATPADPGHPDTLCAGIGQGWDDQWQVYRAVDGTLCNFDDGTCLLPTPADGSSDPLSGMREPHCRLNLCGNGGEGFDREVCNPTPSDGTKAILVDGARESGSYFLVFEKESGAVEIATRHYDPLPPNCGPIDIQIMDDRPAVTFTLHPTSTSRIAVTGCTGTSERQISGDGSQPFTCPIASPQRQVEFSCQGGGGSASVHKMWVVMDSPQVDFSCNGCNRDDPGTVIAQYAVRRHVSVKEDRQPGLLRALAQTAQNSGWQVWNPSSGRERHPTMSVISFGPPSWATTIAEKDVGWMKAIFEMSASPSRSVPLPASTNPVRLSLRRNHDVSSYAMWFVDLDGSSIVKRLELPFTPVFTAGTSNLEVDTCYTYSRFVCPTAAYLLTVGQCHDQFGCSARIIDVHAQVSGRHIVQWKAECNRQEGAGQFDSQPSRDSYALQSGSWHYRYESRHGEPLYCDFWALTYKGEWVRAAVNDRNDQTFRISPGQTRCSTGQTGEEDPYHGDGAFYECSSRVRGADRAYLTTCYTDSTGAFKCR